jgi:cell division transport system ATP-binding protein
MIEFHNVTKRYPNGHNALKNANFNIASGEMVFLTGHSGAGKSTLLKLIAGLEPASFGSINVNNINVHKLKTHKMGKLRRDIGIVLQNPHLVYDQTIFDNVALPLIIQGFSKQDIGKRVRAGLDKVGLLNKEHALPEELSTGEQQRIGLARAVVNKPKLLLADEPTGNLDPELSLEIMRLFQDFNAVGTTVLIATHDVELIDQFDARVLHIEQGNLVEANNNE